MFELRREVERMDNKEIKKEVDPIVYSYLTDLIEIENKKGEEVNER